MAATMLSSSSGGCNKVLLFNQDVQMLFNQDVQMLFVEKTNP